MVYTLQNAVCFITLNVFDSCIIHILYTGCAKIKKFRRQNVKHIFHDGLLKHSSIWFLSPTLSFSKILCVLKDEVNLFPSAVIIIYSNIFIYCNWVVTRWQWLFYMYTKYEIGYY